MFHSLILLTLSNPESVPSLKLFSSPRLAPPAPVSPPQNDIFEEFMRIYVDNVQDKSHRRLYKPEIRPQIGCSKPQTLTYIMVPLTWNAINLFNNVKTILQRLKPRTIKICILLLSSRKNKCWSSGSSINFEPSIIVWIKSS